METFRADDPVTLAQYAQENNLLDKSVWKWANQYLKDKKKTNVLMRRAMSSRNKTSREKYQFGVKVPRTV
jgi:hypothetical protein